MSYFESWKFSILSFQKIKKLDKKSQQKQVQISFSNIQLIFFTVAKDSDTDAPYEVFEGSAWEAGLLKSILEDNEIDAIIQEAYSLPWNVIPVKGAAAKVFVALSNFEKAKVIVDEFYLNMEKENSGDSSE